MYKRNVFLFAWHLIKFCQCLLQILIPFFGEFPYEMWMLMGMDALDLVAWLLASQGPLQEDSDLALEEILVCCGISSR